MQRINLIIIQTMLAGLLLVLITSLAWGAESSGSSRTPAHTPEWTDLNQSDPGKTKGSLPSLQLQAVPSQEPVDSVASDLQKIVVLCATQPQSAEFDRAWALYLEEHYKPNLDVDGLIDDVLTRAENYVRFGDGRRGARQATFVDRDKTGRRMRKVADKVTTRIR